MSSENTLTGRNGKFYATMVDGAGAAAGFITRTTQWAVNPKLASSSTWGDSDSCGYTNRAPGRRDATFSAEGKYDTTDEIFDLFQPGDIATAALFLANTTGLHWYFPRAMNEDFNLTVNIDTEEVIGWTSSWGADGRFYYPGESGTTSVTKDADCT